MSAVICKDCERLFDSDADPDCFVPIPGASRMTPEQIICEHCRDDRDADARTERAHRRVLTSREIGYMMEYNEDLDG